MDDDEICQDVREVTDYSSQYGSYNSISYVALNVIGAPEVFPEYGDYSETFSARTYGPWWLQHSISDRNFNTILPKERHVKSQDYVELQYEHHVTGGRSCGWESPQKVPRLVPGQDHCHWKIAFVTRVLRLEFHHAHLDYHAQIDAVLLAGTFRRPEPPDSESDEQSTVAVAPQSSCKEEAFLPSHAGFHSLPHELLTQIFRYLDLLSICRLSGTCKLFWKKLNLSWCGAGGYLSAEAFVSFMELRGELLQCLCLSSCPFVDNECLKVIADYCPNLTELELKGFWLDLCRTEIEMFSLISIIRNCNKLKHLSLGSCPVVNNYDDIALEISTYLGNLRSLDLYRARTLSSVGANLFARSCPLLVSLDLGWCTSIESGSIQELARGCPHLKRLLLTAVRVLCDTDLYAIATYCHDLEHLDILGSAEASSSGVIQVLNECKQLKILDVSFCFRISLDIVQEWKRLYPKVQIKRSISDPFR
ncbi:hypothetical protein MTO96_020679 [Rhipicephalus appendiculatus]